MIKKLGKRGKAWKKAKVRLKKEFEEKDIIFCEVCGSSWGLSFHHRHKRKENDPHTFENVLLLCPPCHDRAEDGTKGKELTKEWFRKLR